MRPVPGPEAGPGAVTLAEDLDPRTGSLRGGPCRRRGLWSPRFLEGPGAGRSSGQGCELAPLSPGSRTGPHACKGDPSLAGLFARAPWPGGASRPAPQVGKPWAVGRAPCARPTVSSPLGHTAPHGLWEVSLAAAQRLCQQQAELWTSLTSHTLAVTGVCGLG